MFVLEILYTTDNISKVNVHFLFCEKYLIVYNYGFPTCTTVNFCKKVLNFPMPLNFHFVKLSKSSYILTPNVCYETIKLSK